MMKFVFLVVIFCLAVADANWVREMENPGLFQGDMILRPEQKNAVTSKGSTYGSVIGYRWPGGVVPYYINANIGSEGKRAVIAAIADYHSKTCLKFVQRTNQRKYIHFQNGGGCSSPVGYDNPAYRNNGINTVTLAPGCRNKGTVMHEIGHSIGLYHEQSRPDRDNFVIINKNNLYNKNMGYNFDKANGVDSLGEPYDYRSMMHYDSTAFGCDNYGRNCRITIQTKNPLFQNIIGRGDGFSVGDINQIRKMYKCSSTGGTGTGGSGDCVDKNKDCAWWAGNGECQNVKHKGYMLKNCKKSCTHLNGDKQKHCSYWASIGHCDNKNRSFMHANCKKSCNVC